VSAVPPALVQTIPALPVRDAAAAVAFYRDRLGFEVLHHDGGFAVVNRDEAVVHLWEASDEGWQERDSIERPVRSGAESFIAGTASCRIRVEGVDELYGELRESGVLHRVSREGVEETDYGTREFSALDLDGNLIGFFQWVSA
jgi:catechol 2,3-dioxygenase-like lactoylglutathione lyase family enzyme